MIKLKKEIKIDESKYSLENVIPKLLWSNSNPSDNFPAQKVQLDLSKYDMVDIFYVTATNETNEVYVKRILKNYQSMLTRAWNGGDGYVHQFRRTATVADDGISFSTADRSGAGNYTNGYTDKIIPIHIIGYNSKLFN